MGPLSSLLLLPSLGALLIMLLPARLARPLAIVAAFSAFAGALLIGFLLDPAQGGIQLADARVWNARLGTRFAVGIDGISYPMLLLATALSATAVLASTAIRERLRGYFALLLVLESGVLGVFMARDWALFYVFWELTLVPLFFLIDRWGGSNRHGAALNFVLYTMGGSVFMLIALLSLYDAVPGHSFDMASIAAGTANLPVATQVLLFLGLAIGFGVKLPVVPLHGWLPLAHVEAPSPVSILLSGVLLKMGAYGLIRAVETLPGAALALQDWLAAAALLSLLYGGLLAWRQRDLKMLIAYSSVSHMGVVLLGIAALNTAGFQGAVMQMVAHGLVAGLLFLLVGQLYERTHTRALDDYGCLTDLAPRFAFFLSLAFIAAIGLPGTAGFVAELHALVGGFARWGAWLAVLTLGVLVSAAYALRTIGHLLTGPEPRVAAALSDLDRREAMLAAALCGGIVVLGIAPAPALDFIGRSIALLASRFAV
jgi:NADH-quinone oxidoreductase subunit M